MIRNETSSMLLDGIREDIAESVAPELIDTIARAVLAGLQRRYGGHRLYVPVDASRAYPLKEIIQAYASGMQVRTICRRYGISRNVFYRLIRT